MPEPGREGTLALCQRILLEQHIQTAQVLGTAVEMRDHGTGTHNLRVTLYAGALGEALGFDQDTMRDLIAGAFLHDVGKIAIPDGILLKAGPLTADEMAVMRQHSDLGGRLLEQLPAFAGAIAVVRHHHERYDGKGYPCGLAGEVIPAIARAFALVDVFDALVSARPYKRALPLVDVRGILVAGSGSQFDPDFAALFLRLLPELHATFAALGEAELQPHVMALRLRHFGA